MVAISNISLARTIAQQECGAFPFAQLGDSLLNPRTAFDIKNTFAKTGKTVCKWALHLNPEMQNANQVRLAGDAFNNVKNFIGMTEIPGQINKTVSGIYSSFVAPSAANVHKAAISTIGIISPTVDATEFLNDTGVIRLAPETMTALSNLNALALFVSMVDLIVKDLIEIGQNIAAGNMWNLTIHMLDLAKAISYIAMATFIIIAAFFVAVPHTSTWVLATSTSALFFTLLSEFAKRA